MTAKLGLTRHVNRRVISVLPVVRGGEPVLLDVDLLRLVTFWGDWLDGGK